MGAEGPRDGSWRAPQVALRDGDRTGDAAAVVHELTSDLTLILGHAELAAERPSVRADPAAAIHLALIVEQALDASGAIQELAAMLQRDPDASSRRSG